MASALELDSVVELELESAPSASVAPSVEENHLLVRDGIEQGEESAALAFLPAQAHGTHSPSQAMKAKRKQETRVGGGKDSDCRQGHSDPFERQSGLGAEESRREEHHQGMGRRLDIETRSPPTGAAIRWTRRREGLPLKQTPLRTSYHRQGDIEQ